MAAFPVRFHNQADYGDRLQRRDRGGISPLLPLNLFLGYLSVDVIVSTHTHPVLLSLLKYLFLSVTENEGNNQQGNTFRF